jgi:hypothetical protein
MISQEILDKLQDMFPNLQWELIDRGPDVHHIQGLNTDGDLVIKATHWTEPGYKELLDVRIVLEVFDASPEAALGHAAAMQKLLSPTRAK